MALDLLCFALLGLGWVGLASLVLLALTWLGLIWLALMAPSPCSPGAVDEGKKEEEEGKGSRTAHHNRRRCTTIGLVADHDGSSRRHLRSRRRRWRGRGRRWGRQGWEWGVGCDDRHDEELLRDAQLGRDHCRQGAGRERSCGSGGDPRHLDHGADCRRHRELHIHLRTTITGNSSAEYWWHHRQLLQLGCERCTE